MAMALLACVLILVGGLELILEFGSVTFLLVSLLMAVANFKIRKETNSSTFLTVLAIIGLSVGGVLILYYELTNNWEQMLAIVVLYVLLALGAWGFAKRNSNK
jgi:hypothetical protein